MFPAGQAIIQAHYQATSTTQPAPQDGHYTTTVVQHSLYRTNYALVATNARVFRRAHVVAGSVLWCGARRTTENSSKIFTMAHEKRSKSICNPKQHSIITIPPRTNAAWVGWAITEPSPAEGCFLMANG